MYKSEGSSWATAYAQNNPEPFLAGPAGSIYNPVDPTVPSSARFYYSGYIGEHSVTRPGIRIGLRIQDTLPLTVRISNHTRFDFDWISFDKTNDVEIPVAPRENHQSVHTEGNNVWIQVSGPAEAKVGDTVTISTYGELMNDSGLYNASLGRTDAQGVNSTLINVSGVAGNEFGPETVSYQVTTGGEEILDGTTQDIGNIPELEPQRCYMTYPVKSNAPPGVRGELLPSTPDGNNGWYKSQVTVIGKAYDPEDGWLPTTPATYDGKEGVNGPYLFRATDSDGLTGEGYSLPFKQDTEKPFLVAMIPTLIPGSNGWYKSVSITFQFSDLTSGIDGPDEKIVILNEGLQQIASWTASDMAGNQDTFNSDPYDVDGTPPILTFTLDPQPDFGDWYNGESEGSVWVIFNATDPDPGSGIKIPKSGQFKKPVSGDKIHSVTYTAMDNAGNKSNTETAKVFIDRHPPDIPKGTVNLIGTITGLSSDDIKSQLGAMVTDKLSGVASTLFSGIPTGGIGSGAWADVTITAKDNANNKTTETVKVFVKRQRK